MKTCCWNCKFWVTDYPWLDDKRAVQAEPGPAYRLVGECRKHAPVIFGESVRAWPQTLEHVYCGDHEPARFERGED